MTLQDLNARFQYRSDTEQHSLQEKWTILRNTTGPLVGDCEDYALTALWMINGRNDPAFHQSLKSGKAKIHFCYTPRNIAHAVLEYNGLLLDNIQKEWLSKKAFESLGYRFEHVFSYSEVTHRLQAGMFNLLPIIQQDTKKNPAKYIGIALAVAAATYLIIQNV